MKAMNLKEIINGLDDNAEVSVFVTSRMGEYDASIMSIETKTIHLESIADKTISHEQYVFINCIENVGRCDPISGNPAQEKNDCCRERYEHDQD